MHAFVIFCTILMVAISVNLNWIGPLFLKGEAYASGFFIVPILLMGYLLLGVYFNLSIWFKVTDKTQYSFWITLIGALVSVGVIVVFVPVWGFLGGALSTLACYLVMTVICYGFGQKFYRIPYQTGRDVFYLILGFAISYGGFFLKMDSFILSFLIQNSLILALLALIGFLEKDQFASLLKRKKSG
jgi:O-antigen/teichoic acid export membrane protein